MNFKSPFLSAAAPYTSLAPCNKNANEKVEQQQPLLYIQLPISRGLGVLRGLGDFKELFTD